MKNLVITIAEDYLDSIDAIAQLLLNDGMQVSKVFEFGVITGAADENIVGKLIRHEGILSVNEDQNITIAPPDSDIQ